MITADEFTRLTGYAPEQDDLDRANCSHAGQIGHQHCGLCLAHGVPRFLCERCMIAEANRSNAGEGTGEILR